MNEIFFSPALCRAGRALAGITQKQLAEKADVGDQTIADFEREERRPHDTNLRKLMRALEDAGVFFIEENGGGAGVRFRRYTIRLFRRRDVPHRNWIAASVDYKGKRETLFVHYDALARVALDNIQPIEAFDRNVSMVLGTAREMIEANRRDDAGNVHIRPGDL